MAIKSTIYKAQLNVADLDRQVYGDFALTLARHPSETDERLMVRLVAFAHNADEALTFCKGISDTDEPDLWQHDLTGVLQRWVEVGMPDERRIGRASGRAGQVDIYAYGNGVAQWWKAIEDKLKRFDNVRVTELPLEATRALMALADRTMNLQATLQEGQLLLTGEQATVTVDLRVLKQPTR